MQTTNLKTTLLIIGAGVVGLAIARTLAGRGLSVVLIDSAPQVGMGVSSRSSEVIHAGIYYPPNSLKAKLCLRGKQLLVEYCQRRSVPFRQCGKWVVATTTDELAALDRLQTNAHASGLTDLILNGDQHQLKEQEPELNACAVLESPSSGIVDSHILMQSLLGEFESMGGLVALKTEVKSITKQVGGYRAVLHSVDEHCEIEAECVINAAGLQATQVAGLVGGLPSQAIPPLYLCKGSYFSYRKQSPFKRLIYPVPAANLAGLGVHATLDLSGALRFGPDVEYLPSVEVDELVSHHYQVDESKANAFKVAIQRYYPSITTDDLLPAYAGIRPKLSAPGEPAHDFVIREEREHGFPGLVNLFGIESPGLTASLAIAEYVRDLL